jgi:hypothetical protein
VSDGEKRDLISDGYESVENAAVAVPCQQPGENSQKQLQLERPGIKEF